MQPVNFPTARSASLRGTFPLRITRSCWDASLPRQRLTRCPYISDMFSPAVKRITTLIHTSVGQVCWVGRATIALMRNQFSLGTDHSLQHRPRILVALRRPIIPIRKPNPTVLAWSFHVDVLPDLPPRARCLDQAGRFAELGEGEGLVLALESVCVVLAHDDVCIDGREKKK